MHVLVVSLYSCNTTCTSLKKNENYHVHMEASVYKPCSSIIVSQSTSLRAHATTVNSNPQNSRALINQPELIANGRSLMRTIIWKLERT